MENRRAGACQTPARGGIAWQTSRPFRGPLAEAFWTGQMVSRRAAPAMGIRLLLAQRWSADLGGWKPDRGAWQRLRLHDRSRAKVSGSAHTPSSSRRLIHDRRI